MKKKKQDDLAILNKYAEKKTVLKIAENYNAQADWAVEELLW